MESIIDQASAFESLSNFLPVPAQGQGWSVPPVLSK
jgi:hypothetical protein